MNKNLLIASAIATLVFWAVMGVNEYRHHRSTAMIPYTEKNAWEYKAVNRTMIEPCKLQMDKTKPNYNDCGAFTEPVSPMGKWDGK